MRSKRLKFVAKIICAATFFGNMPVSAHHSFAMFDFSKTVTIKGTVKQFQWTNPHVILWVYTDPDPSQTAPEVWAIELTSPGNLTRTGWTRHALNTGDRLEVDISPLRDGTHGGAFKKAVVEGSGQTLISNLRAQEKPELE